MDAFVIKVEKGDLAMSSNQSGLNINNEGKLQDDVADEAEDDQCAVCLDGTTYDDNCILYCDKCNVAVHQTCYGVDEIPSGSWFCDVCRNGQMPETTTCELCSNTGGAYKPCEKPGCWVHVMCALWIPEVYMPEQGVYDISNVDKSRFRMRCRLCNTKGAIVQCAYGRCTTPVHPWCALKGNKGYTHRIVKSPDTPGLCYWEIFCATHADCVKDPVKPKPKAKRIHFLNDDDEKVEKPKRRGRKKKSEDVNGDSEEDESHVVIDADGYLVDTSLFAEDDITPRVSEPDRPASVIPNGHAMYGFTEWPGQAEGEAMDLFHFWNIVSMYYPEDYSEEWLSFMAEPFVDAKKCPIAGFDETVTASPEFGSIEHTMKLLEAANEEVLKVGALLTDREKVFLWDNNKRLQLCGQILRIINRIQNDCRNDAPHVSDQCNEDMEEYDSRSEMSGLEESQPTGAAINASDLESQVYLDYVSFLTSEISNTVESTSTIVSANTNVMSVVFNTIQGRLATLYKMHHTSSPSSEHAIALSPADPRTLWDDMGVLSPSPGTRVDISGCATASLVSVSPVDNNAPVHLADRTIIPRNDEDDICYIARSEKALLCRLWNSIAARITALFDDAKIMRENATKELEIHPDEYDAVETSYLKQRAWKRIAQGVVRGVQDHSHDFNRPIEDSVPASWTIQVQGRPKPEDEEEEEQEDAVCMVCFDGSSHDGNKILFCDGCNAAVHQTCYGIAEIPDGDFFCERCCRVRRLAESSRIDPGEEVRDVVTCCLCSQRHGGLKATTSPGQWVHLCCALWAPQTIIGDVVEMTAIDIRNIPMIINMKRRRNVYEHLETIRLETAKNDSVPEMLLKEERGAPQSCIYCKESLGYAVFCDHEEDGLCCTASFHPLCAWFAGAFIRASNDDPTFISEQYPAGLNFSYRCLEHSPTASMSREEQKALRVKYRINENDLCVIPGFQKKRKNRKKNKATATNGPKVKELNIDTYDEELCAACMQPINHALTNTPLPFIACSQCKLNVHTKCTQVTEEPWICALCQEGDLQCAFCPRRGGIFSSTAEGKWAHSYCSTYKVGFHRSDLKKEKKVSCSFCNRRSGNIVNCHQTGCTQSFHPLCAIRSHSVYFQVQHGNKQAYCLEHIPKTVIRIPSGHWVNVEEVRRLRQSLDMARVIFDRMQKREKLKRSYYKTKGESFALIAKNLHSRLLKRLSGDIEGAEDIQDIPDLDEILSEPDEEVGAPTPKKRGRKKGFFKAFPQQPFSMEDEALCTEESFVDGEMLEDLEEISATWLNRKGQLAIPKQVYVAFSGQEVCISGRQGRLPSLQDYAKNVKNDINRTVDASRTALSIFSSQRSFAEFDRKLEPWVDHYLSRSLQDIEENADVSHFVELEQELTLAAKRGRGPKSDKTEDRPSAAKCYKAHHPVHAHANLEHFTTLYNQFSAAKTIASFAVSLPKDEYNDSICQEAPLVALERNIFHILDFLATYEIPLKEFEKYEYHVDACFDAIASKLFNSGRRRTAKASDTFLISDEFQSIPYDEIPNYDALVSTPLVFPTLKHNLQAHRYTSFGAFASDFYLMLSNARFVTGPGTSTWWKSELLAMLFKLLNEKLKSVANTSECLFYGMSGQWFVMEPAAYYATLTLSQRNTWSQPCPACNRTFEYPLVDTKAKAEFDENWRCVCTTCLDCIRPQMQGLSVQIYWTDDKQYYSGMVENFDAVSGEHSVLYTDNEVEFLRIGAEPYLLNMKELKKKKLLPNLLLNKRVKEEDPGEVKADYFKTPKKSKIVSELPSSSKIKPEAPATSERSSRKRRSDNTNDEDLQPQETSLSKKKKREITPVKKDSPPVDAPRSLRKRGV